MRYVRVIVFAMAALVCALAPARADKRVALVIGNSHYQHVGLLPNPASDAAAMAALFNAARFDVVDTYKDLSIAAMRRAVSDFADKAQGSDIAVVYYAGHGIEVDGVNYLIPVDAVLFVYGSLGGREIAIVEGGGAPPANGGRENPAPGGGLVSEAAQVWATVKTTTDVAEIDRFLQHYGAVPFYGDETRAKRAELERLAMLAPPPRRDGEPLTPNQERGLKRGDTFRECANCPEMVVVPSGSFTMGSPSGEPDRYSDEGPQHLVTIGSAFAVGKFDVTRDQFAVFANETGFTAHSNCDWRNPGFVQDGTHPVVCVSWDDANAYANWLVRKMGRPYRL